jgi:multicomponent Na+:H+ antiporter subunit B
LKWLVLPLLVGVAALFIVATADLPDRGDPNAPANLHVAPEYIERTEKDIGIENVVTAVLADYRSYDTLGETVVIFTAGMAVLAVLARRERHDRQA